MFVVSNKNVDKWGKYFYQREQLRQYLFSIWRKYDEPKFQTIQRKKLFSRDYMINMENVSEEELKNYGLSQQQIIQISRTSIAGSNDSLACLPLLLVTNDPSTFIDHKVRPLSKNYLHKLLESLTDECIERMGSGYTDFTTEYDGSAALTPTAIELVNGDFIVCLTWEWYNK